MNEFCFCSSFQRSELLRFWWTGVHVVLLFWVYISMLCSPTTPAVILLPLNLQSSIFKAVLPSCGQTQKLIPPEIRQGGSGGRDFSLSRWANIFSCICISASMWLPFFFLNTWILYLFVNKVLVQYSCGSSSWNYFWTLPAITLYPGQATAGSLRCPTRRRLVSTEW